MTDQVTSFMVHQGWFTAIYYSVHPQMGKHVVMLLHVASLSQGDNMRHFIKMEASKGNWPTKVEGQRKATKVMVQEVKFKSKADRRLSSLCEC